jgi:hypothetical protein
VANFFSRGVKNLAKPVDYASQKAVGFNNFNDYLVGNFIELDYAFRGH